MWMNLIFLLLLLVIFTPAATMLYGVSRWQAGTSRRRSRLEGARSRIQPSHHDAAELEGLPAPVQGYFRAIMKDGQPMIAAAEIGQRGHFDFGRGKPRWLQAVANQSVVTQRPGFDWDARIRLNPVMKVFAHDSYLAGTGSLRVALLGLFPIARVPPGAELAHAELMRFLAEAPWYPTALLPSQGVRWEAIDARSARATLTDGDRSAVLVFQFDEADLIVGVEAIGRYRAVDGRMVATPWKARFSSYQERSGILVPTQAEVMWVLPEGPSPYWRGELTEILYKFAA